MLGDVSISTALFLFLQNKREKERKRKKEKCTIINTVQRIYMLFLCMEEKKPSITYLFLINSANAFRSSSVT